MFSLQRIKGKRSWWFGADPGREREDLRPPERAREPAGRPCFPLGPRLPQHRSPSSPPLPPARLPRRRQSMLLPGRVPCYCQQSMQIRPGQTELNPVIRAGLSLVSCNHPSPSKSIGSHRGGRQLGSCARTAWLSQNQGRADALSHRFLKSRRL